MSWPPGRSCAGRSWLIKTFLGIDLTSSTHKPSASVALDEKGRVVYTAFLPRDEDIIETAQRLQPNLIAIDAPLGLPQGLGCLEEPCVCGYCQPGTPRFRECELCLRRLGIGCFYTTKKTIIKAMVYRGIALREEFTHRGCQVIEVYPYATKVRLWGRPIPPKRKPQGRAFLKEKLFKLIPSLPGESLNHDLADAALAAYTGLLHARGQTQALGSAEEGQIIIPP